MKIKFERKVTIEKNISFVKISARLYPDDYNVIKDKEILERLLPLMDGEYDECSNNDWNILIDAETGQIMNWEKGISADIHAKVCDRGKYSLITDGGSEILKLEGYVPSSLDFHHGFGDYLEFDINKDGVIKEWKNFDINKFVEEANQVS